MWWEKSHQPQLVPDSWNINSLAVEVYFKHTPWMTQPPSKSDASCATIVSYGIWRNLPIYQYLGVQSMTGGEARFFWSETKDQDDMNWMYPPLPLTVPNVRFSVGFPNLKMWCHPGGDDCILIGGYRSKLSYEESSTCLMFFKEFPWFCAPGFLVLYFYISNRAFWTGFFSLSTVELKKNTSQQWISHLWGIVGCIINESISDVSVKQKPLADIPLYWLVHKDPYSGLLQSHIIPIYRWVG